MSVVAKPVAASRAVVLRTWPTGETSVIAALLTEAHGYVRVIAKGARGARSALRPLVQPGRLVDIEFGLQPERELQYLKGGQLLLDPLLTANSLERTAYLLSALEIVDRCRPSGVTETRLFDLCRRFMEVLSSDDAGAEAPLFYAFELALLRLQGTAPVLDRCVSCDGDPARAGTGLRFSPAAGGVVCGGCVAADPENGGRRAGRHARPDGRRRHGCGAGPPPVPGDRNPAARVPDLSPAGLPPAGQPGPVTRRTYR